MRSSSVPWSSEARVKVSRSGEIWAGYCTYYNRAEPEIFAALPCLPAVFASYSALCLMIQSRLTEPRFAGADRRDLSAAATIETTTAPEMTHSVSMAGFSFEQRLDAVRVARASFANPGPDELPSGNRSGLTPRCPSTGRAAPDGRSRRARRCRRCRRRGWPGRRRCDGRGVPHARQRLFERLDQRRTSAAEETFARMSPSRMPYSRRPLVLNVVRPCGGGRSPFA
jgi:hypothetical protein